MPLTIDYRSDQATKVFNQASPNAAKQAPSPDEFYGKVRVFRGYYKNLTGAAITTSKILSLATLPQGRLLPMSTIYFTAFGASATLDIGVNDYRDNQTGVVTTGSATAWKTGLSVASAGSYVFGTDYIQGINLTGPTEVVVRTGGANMPTNAEVSAFFLVAVD